MLPLNKFKSLSLVTGQAIAALIETALVECQLRPCRTSTLMRIPSAFKPVWLCPHYMHDFITDLNVHLLQS